MRIIGCLTFNTNKAAFSTKLIYQILDSLWSMILVTIQANPDVLFLVHSWAKLSQVLTTNRASEIIVLTKVLAS